MQRSLRNHLLHAAGCALLLEKPLATDPTTARALATAVAEAGVGTVPAPVRAPFAPTRYTRMTLPSGWSA